MPGIVGLITKMPRERAEAQLRVMVESICHERFYSSGLWTDESAGVYVGWVEPQGSLGAGNPLVTGGGDIVLAFSGEEFPEPTAACRLKPDHLASATRASYIVDSCKEDRSFPVHLNGLFHGLLVDRTHGTSMLFNDRYGLHRLYYHESSEAFYFGAEAKAILSVRPELRRLEPRAFGEFVSCGCVLENRTLFQGVYVLPAAAKWRFDHGSLTERSNYFHPSEWEGQDPLDPEAYYQAILEVFSRNLPRYFAGPHKIGLSLTGGLDTRMIMAWHKAAANAFPCYTFGGMVRDSQDVRVARQVARICQQPHQVIRVDEKFLRDFSYYAERTVYLTDGCADVSRSADLYINQIARQIAPVRMTGNYGGEVMRSVRAFKPMNPMQELYDPEVLSRTKEATQTYADLIRIHPLSFAAFRQIPWHHYGLFALERTQISLRSPYLDNDFVRTLFRAPQSEGTNNDICLRLVRDGNEPLSRLPTDRGVGRAGFLQAVRRTALEFQFKAEYAYDYGMPHWAVPFDRLLSGLHPEQVFLGRHKFAHYRLWYRKILSGYVQEVLLDRRSLSRPHIQRKAVEALVNGHLKGVKNYTSEIHKLLTAELLCRSLLDSKPARVSDPM